PARGRDSGAGLCPSASGGPPPRGGIPSDARGHNGGGAVDRREQRRSAGTPSYTVAYPAGDRRAGVTDRLRERGEPAVGQIRGAAAGCRVAPGVGRGRRERGATSPGGGRDSGGARGSRRHWSGTRVRANPLLAGTPGRSAAIGIRRGRAGP